VVSLPLEKAGPPHHRTTWKTCSTSIQLPTTLLPEVGRLLIDLSTHRILYQATLARHVRITSRRARPTSEEEGADADRLLDLQTEAEEVLVLPSSPSPREVHSHWNRQ
jgi:hypothetical protein